MEYKYNNTTSIGEVQSSKLAQSIRHRNRKSPTTKFNQEEFQFISIDSALFPQFYQPGFKPFPRYDLCINRERLSRIIQLPKEIQIAIGYLHSETELRAHYIVNKYYDAKFEDTTGGSGGGSSSIESPPLLCLDEEEQKEKYDDHEEEQNDPVVSMKNSGKKLYDVDDLSSEIKSFQEKHKELISILHSTITDAAVSATRIRLEEVEFTNVEELMQYDKRFFEDRKPFILLDDTISVFNTSSSSSSSSSSTPLETNENVKHRFILQDDDSWKKCSSITISIVYHGTFVDGAYSPARLSASFHRLRQNDDGDDEVMLRTKSVATGYAPYDLQVINTKKHLGRITIKFDVEENQRIELTDVFEIQLHAHSTCQYSIDVSCKATYYANHVLVHDLCSFFKRKKEVREHRRAIANAKLDERTSKRKISTLKDLIEVSETLRIRCEKNIDSKELELDTDDNFRVGMKELKKLELEYAGHCRLISVRQQSIQDTINCIDEIVREQNLHSDLALDLEKQNESYLEILPRAFDNLFGNGMFDKVNRVMLEEEDDGSINTVEMENLSSVKKDSRYTSLHDAPTVACQCRLLLQEIDRVDKVRDKHVASAMLHAMAQLFPKDILLKKLEKEIERVILGEIRREELGHPLLTQEITENFDDADNDSVDTLDSESYNDLKGENNLYDTFDDGISSTRSASWSPCSDNNSIDVTKLSEQRDQISATLLSIKQEQYKISKRGDETHFASQQQLEDERIELAIKLKRIDEELKLAAVDKELHDSYKNTSEYIVVRSLHGYETLMHRGEAIDALNAEHNRLVAALVSKEVIDDILERMLNGWHFGVPVRFQNDAAIHNLVPNAPQINETETKIHAIKQAADERAHGDFILRHNQQSRKFLQRTEKSIKIGFACLILKYFNAVNVVKEEKERWSIDDDYIGVRKKNKEKIYTKERLKMMEEEKNAFHRSCLIKDANERAQRGAEAIRRRKEKATAEKIRNMHLHHFQSTVRKASAIIIQCHYRGHLGRKVGRRWARLRANVYAFNALCNGSAITITRVYRGHIARKHAAALRSDLAEYILAIRESEIKEEEEQYWANLRFGQWRRKRDQRLKQKARMKANCEL